MRLGIDFGTTRTRVAAAIRGNYPLITFQAGRDHALDWYPSLIATRGDQVAFGLRAQAVQYDPEWSLFRSFKRLLRDSHQDTTWTVGEGRASDDRMDDPVLGGAALGSRAPEQFGHRSARPLRGHAGESGARQ